MIGKTIDELYQLREERLRVTKLVDEMKQRESALQAQIMAELQEQGLTGARGDVATAGLGTDTVPAVRDWKVLHTHIVATDGWDLLQNRVSTTACKARWTRSEAVPGVEPMEIFKLSLSKAER